MKIIKILLVEDDYLDTIDIRRTLDKMKIAYSLQVARNGEEAIGLLNAAGEQATDPLPDMVLIDLNMPKMNGLEFLSVVRDTDRWRHLKCFIITTSEEAVDREAARQLGISGYITKPFKLNNPSSPDSLNLAIDLINLKS